jgi:hypothetical protein
MPGDSSEGPEHVEFIDDFIKSWLCLTVMCMPVLIYRSLTGWITMKLSNYWTYDTLLVSL